MGKNTERTINIFTTLILTFLVTQNLIAVTNYVSKTGAHVSPFISWANAATNIQDAVDAASAGNIVLVNDGTYYPGSQITVTKDITVKSVNGAENTIVNGSDSHRCFYLNDANPTINGFTITKGKTGYAGGVWCDHGGTIQNSILWNNNGLEISGTPSVNIYNCIENWTNIVDGIITNNPQFVDISSGNYHLKPNSPCINSGTNMAWMIGAKDLDGNPRIIDVLSKKSSLKNLANLKRRFQSTIYVD